MQGLFARWLLTGRFRTHNPYFLFILWVTGLVAISPLILSLACILLGGEWWTLRVVALFALHIVLGIAVLVNVALSIFEPDAESNTDNLYEEPELAKTAGLGLLAIAPLLLALFLFLSLGHDFRRFYIVEDGIVQINFGVLVLIILFGRLTQAAVSRPGDN